jgi:hypothetical protein
LSTITPLKSSDDEPELVSDVLAEFVVVDETETTVVSAFLVSDFTLFDFFGDAEISKKLIENIINSLRFDFI